MVKVADRYQTSRTKTIRDVGWGGRAVAGWPGHGRAVAGLWSGGGRAGGRAVAGLAGGRPGLVAGGGGRWPETKKVYCDGRALELSHALQQLLGEL